MTNQIQIEKIIQILKQEYKKLKAPVITLIATQNKDPFKVLLSTIISLRTKDEVTIEASKKLFKILNTPKDIYNLTPEQIENAIYPAGFYKTKTKTITQISKRLVEKFQSKVPHDIDTLLTFKGVGRKTANLVLIEGYNIPAICVDTHVHRISNRLGLVKTKTPTQTETQLEKKLPKKHWIIYNTMLVAWGQKICRPISPFCTTCAINKYCNKIGVEKFR